MPEGGEGVDLKSPPFFFLFLLSSPLLSFSYISLKLILHFGPTLSIVINVQLRWWLFLCCGYLGREEHSENVKISILQAI